MNWKKKIYQAKEQELKAQGIKHIRYTKHGVPLPDWDKIISEKVEEIKRKEEREV